MLVPLKPATGVPLSVLPATPAKRGEEMPRNSSLGGISRQSLSEWSESKAGCRQVNIVLNKRPYGKPKTLIY